MILRDYQEAAVDSLFTYFAKKSGNPIIALPTGTGKSVVIASFIQRACYQYPGTRIMKLTHSKELIEQNYERFLQLWPTAPAGVYSAGLKRKDTGNPIVFGGIGTVANADPEIFGRIDLLLIDECHLLSPKNTTQYQKVIAGLKETNPYLKVVGLTATPYRMGTGMLTDPGQLFTDLAFDLTDLESFNWLLNQGYLSMLVPKMTALELDVSGVHLSGGEFKQNELQAAVDQDAVTRAAVAEMVEHGVNRNHWLIFASGIEHAEHVTDILLEYGIRATYVHSKISTELRDARIDGFKAGYYQAVVNNGILTTGFDFPGIDLIGVLRPTHSASLWVQMLGRGTRPVYAPGFDLSGPQGRLEAIKQGPKQNTLVMDFAGNSRRLGPINDPILPKKKGKGKGKGMAPIKVCPACMTYNHASVRFCTNCLDEFPKDVKIEHEAGTAALIADATIRISDLKVDRVTYRIHEKEGRPPSMQVSYFCGLSMFREWVCFEHQGYPKHKAHQWWRERAGTILVPNTTTEAMTYVDDLRIPVNIRVQHKKSFDEVIGYDYTGQTFSEGDHDDAGPQHPPDAH
jgi:DNA repair protein RadD